MYYSPTYPYKAAAAAYTGYATPDRDLDPTFPLTSTTTTTTTITPNAKGGNDIKNLNIPTSLLCLAEGGGVICVGLPRSGTLSIRRALQILGHDRILHGFDLGGTTEGWEPWRRASWANLPYLRNKGRRNKSSSCHNSHHHRRHHYQQHDRKYSGGGGCGGSNCTSPSCPPPYDRREWDELLGSSSQGVMELGAIFAPQLIRAYPQAKVILWERDRDSWAASFDRHIIQAYFGGLGWWVLRLGWLLGRTSNVEALYDMAVGWTGAEEPGEMAEALGRRYAEHFDEVRRIASPENLLEFKMEEGWRPLCEFLGLPPPPPGVPFPRLNEGKQMQKATDIMFWRLILRFLAFTLQYLLATVAIISSIYILWRLVAGNSWRL